MKAYVAHGEKAQIICAYDKDAGKALKKISSLVTKMANDDEWTMLNSVNVYYDDEGYYNVSAVVSTTA